MSPRPWTGISDLLAMQDLVRASFRAVGPRLGQLPGDLSWWAHMHGDAGLADRVRLWWEGDTLRAWSWWWPKGVLDVHTDDPALLAEMLDFLEPEAPEGPTVYLRDWDTGGLAVIAARGYQATGHSYVITAQPLDAPPPARGNVIVRSVGPEDIKARVDVHRAVFAPSRVTAETWRAVCGAPLYRPELDIVVENAEGGFDATCLAWYDPALGIGELEPVSTRPGAEGRGLAQAACTEALRRLHAADARQAIVYHHEDTRAGRLYAGLGFVPVARNVGFRRS